MNILNESKLREIKKYFDKYRNVGKMPPEIEGKIEGQLLADLELLKK